MNIVKLFFASAIAFILTAVPLLNTSASTIDSDSADSVKEKYGEVVTYVENVDPETLTDSSYVEPKNRVFVSEQKAALNNKLSKVNPDNIISPYYGESEKSTVKKIEYHKKNNNTNRSVTRRYKI